MLEALIALTVFGGWVVGITVGHDWINRKAIDAQLVALRALNDRG